jgi:hypothetical protein
MNRESSRCSPGAIRDSASTTPYHESDHVLNIAYNCLCGGTCLEDLKLVRNDEVYLNALVVSWTA